MKQGGKIKMILNYLWLHGWKYRAIERQHKRLVRQLIREHRPINVVFMALDISLWRYQEIYELMADDPRFNPTIVLSPCTLRENPDKDADGLRQFFNEKGIPYIDYKHGAPAFDIRKELNPDIMFYTQPYEYLLQDEHDCRRFYDRLICYMPYGFWSSTGKLSYDLHFHNQAWRLYYSTSLHLAEARKVATNKGRNVCVTGYANADEYLKPDHQNVWKTIGDGKARKRIIWAPHFSIISENSAFPPRANFLWMAELMLSIAREYKDQIQIAFKPHPALLTQLYQHKDWGKQRADAYYQQWKDMDNAQLEEGQFIDLFMTSDAMIHDSGSFAVEYHYSKNPVMFVSKDMYPITSVLSDFGKKAYALHYIGSVEADIRNFIEQQVLAGDDPMKAQREEFFQNYLLPPNGKSVAQNVIDDIVESLQL